MRKAVQLPMFPELEHSPVTDKAAKDDYEAFTEKFRPKLTTDDCYTPPAVYDAVLEFCRKRLGTEGRPVVRPFFPGGNYRLYPYPENCVVIDNPPFSIYAQIIRFYLSRGIGFFLFAPSLTQAVAKARLTYIVSASAITYENGAVVRTGFTTNLCPGVRFWLCPELRDMIKEAEGKTNRAKPKAELPADIVTPARLLRYAHSMESGDGLKITEDSCEEIGREHNGIKLFGSGFRVSPEIRERLEDIIGRRSQRKDRT